MSDFWMGFTIAVVAFLVVPLVEWRLLSLIEGAWKALGRRMSAKGREFIEHGGEGDED